MSDAIPTNERLFEDGIRGIYDYMPLDVDVANKLAEPFWVLLAKSEGRAHALALAKELEVDSDVFSMLYVDSCPKSTMKRPTNGGWPTGRAYD